MIIMKFNLYFFQIFLNSYLDLAMISKCNVFPLPIYWTTLSILRWGGGEWTIWFSVSLDGLASVSELGFIISVILSLSLSYSSLCAALKQCICNGDKLFHLFLSVFVQWNNYMEIMCNGIKFLWVFWIFSSIVGGVTVQFAEQTHIIIDILVFSVILLFAYGVKGLTYARQLRNNCY